MAAYFDAASAAPLHPVARQALLAALDEGWADPARLYREGRRARLLLDAARETVAEMVGCRADELVFTPSGTRSVHEGVAGALAGRRRVGRHMVVSAVEHSSVLHATTAENGGEVTEVGTDRAGRVGAEEFGAALRADTALACLQSANHEVGTVQPVAEVAELCRAAGVPLLVDAAQSLGWGPAPDGWSLLAASAHKWGGPAGVGLLAVRKGTRYSVRGPADERESGRAPGFENLPAIVAAAASLRAVRAEAAAEGARLSVLVERIRRRVPELVPDVEVVGDAVRRLPHIVTFSCLYVDGESLLHELDRAGFSVSSGSSCTSSTLTPSHVLKAMGVLSEGNVRVSLPPGTEAADVDRFLDVLPGIVRSVRERLGAPTPASAPTGNGGDEPALVVDSLGKRCPIPVIELAKVIGDVPVGAIVSVLSDDEAARLDIPAWCAMREQEYVAEHPAPRGSAYWVRRLG
ncbi:cysteine desulfurase/sulfurtransferase TusA family protein [Actinacidiphila oryziradicis]|uniref:Aminotransferase class V-fold PLP-dependent enzyme n=1 Tax=Actinacidiphila oryziradicis TaxID=2571141 RepID=A0A4U0SKA1_9ACTN|nr:cysteine desulfurase/sulfurtransferase TusA family protein [Actinacidiphila oryziradicis]TKA08617.1 aminotransferase class V-fold PLP-dependent enzyme [Actinacidiphila oryziradicis]